ncbi:unnamed protein product [Sphagnum jensenii]|uniref:DUF4005 domain-containing protein n=1 Tax=Sphagnum jensenii TaxID=128206 RepID=A0ABP1AYQ5_9BRYO
MGKPNKTTAWFQAVKKAFRSPSKEKSDNKDSDMVKKIHTSEKFGSNITASTMTLLQEPTPLPLPSFGKMSLDEAEQQQQQGRSNNKKQPPITTNAVIGAAAAATDAHVMLDNSAQEKEHKWELSPPLAVAARDVESIITTGSNHAKQSASELVLHQEQDESSLADPTVTKIEQAFARGLVRLQALVRGHRVRRQAGTTLRAVEALVRVQARIRGHHVRMSKEGQAVQYKLLQHRQINGSCANQDILAECRDASFTQCVEDGARKHERIVAHVPFSQQLKQNGSNPMSLLMDGESDHQHHWIWSWLERWTAARPWENHYLDDQKETSGCRTTTVSEASPGKFCDSGTKEAEAGSMTKKVKKKVDGENLLAAGALNPQIRNSKSPVQESLFKSIPFPLPTPPSAADPFSVSKPMSALVDVVHSPPGTNNQVDSQLLEPSTPEGPLLPPLKGFADSPPSRVPPSPPAVDESTMAVLTTPLVSMDSLHAPFSPTATAPSPLQAQLSPDLPGVSSLKEDEEEEEEEEEEAEEEENGVVKDGETNELMMCLESCNLSTLMDGYEQHEQQGGGSTGSKVNVKLTPTGNGKSEMNTMNDKAVGEENGENAVPTSFKSSSSTTTTSRYMTATESAKAKFRSLSNPKNRSPDDMEMRAKPPQRRLSQGAGAGGAQLGKSNSQSSTSRNQHANSFQTHVSPKGRIWNEKSEGEIGSESPRRRDSYGGGETKPAIRWR